MISTVDVVDLASSARKSAGSLHQRRREVRDLYGGDLAVPLSELYEDERAATANLLRHGVDSTAQRVASTSPEIQWHPLRPGFKQHEERAREQRQVSLGWHEANAMDLIRYRRARHLVADAESPVELRWDRKRMIPCWEVRDPLDVFCAPPSRLDEMAPPWTVACFSQAMSWLARAYPEQWKLLRRDGDTPSTVVELIRYKDAVEDVLVAVGRRAEWEQAAADPIYSGRAVLLERVPNPVGRPLVVVPGRIGLGKERRGQVDGMVPKYIKQARLEALELWAVEEGIFPKQWLVSRPNEIAKIVQVAKPREGVIGIVQGGEIDTQHLNPGYKTSEAKADLERAQRIEGGVTAISTGEAFSGSRTARMSELIEGGATDLNIGEMQKVLDRSEQAELEIAAELAKAYAGNVSVSMYVAGKGSKGPVSYKADELFEGRCHVSVTRPMPGADVNQQVVRIGQKMQLELISKQSAREQDPEVRDAELEHDRIVSEGLEDALLVGIKSGAASPEPPYSPAQIARIRLLVRTNRMDLDEAVAKVDEEARELQAQAPAVPPEGLAADPNAMPGLTGPPQAMGAPPDLAGLAARLSGAMGGGQAA